MRTGPNTPDDWRLSLAELDVDLLHRYWLGTTSRGETAEVDAWLSALPERRRWYAQFHEGLVTGVAKDLTPEENERLKADTFGAIRVPAKQMLVASPHGAQRSPSTMFGLPFSRHLVLGSLGVGVAAVAVIFATMLFTNPRSTPTPASSRTYTTTPGQRATVVLTDGTRVRLGPASTLTVSNGFGRKQRDVRLSGAASFEVTTVAGAPFAVHAGPSIARVLGTVFAVRRYDTDATALVSVTSGKVAVRSTAGHERVVVAGTSVAATDSSVSESKVNRGDITAWIEGRLRFNDVPLRDVAHELSRAYGVTLVIDSALMNRRVSINAEAGVTPLASVIDALTQLTGAHYRIDNRKSPHTITIIPGRQERARPRNASPFVSETHHGR